ncbi:bifunctional diguanylate cyclase/phosphodiesterase [Guptibacillus hwajinpoensis]|uniref:Diguanylate cyclase (GGDEF)-like protein/PAS domain S-box-containing protein n=1 Tax=Guptibacillus hwajinpoensis TaxID=208199 RepID=A0ABU0K5H0_9BACL|nr:EAL domain-containing protein [Alkalihalobacillus hemicentroti]MDQ0484593.1 diguanylate cyclase (GGDEF)-like protein/PAS domain S-box-containing protein [Alkalihalobacillus hemicentroti]
MMQMSGQYNLWIIILSIFIAIIASYSALDLAGRVSHAKGLRRWVWIVGGAGAMGIGIWSMHFIGMLAFSMSIPMTYDLSLVFLSIGASFLGALIALIAVGSQNQTNIRLIIGTVFMACAIVAMHYIGMEAMEKVIITYNRLLLGLSILIAVVASFIALKLSFAFSTNKPFSNDILLKVISASVMGFAIAGMHYVGIEAATFTLSSAVNDEYVEGLNTNTLSIVIAVCSLCIQTIMIFGIVTERRFIKQSIELKGNDYRLRSLLSYSIDAIMTLSVDGRIRSLNPAGEKLFNVKNEQLRSINPMDFFEKDDYEQMRQHFLKVHETKRAVSLNTKVYTVLGDVNELNVTFVPIYLNDKLDRIYAITKDITKQRKAERETQQMAYYDSLTLLPNRRFFGEFLEKVLQGKEDRCDVAVMMLDLDRFKVINDALGHNTGDEFLIAVAKRLQSCVEAYGFLARLGGDEFVIVLNDFSKVYPDELADEIIACFKESFIVGSHELSTSVSIGIALAPDDGENVESLMKHADIAMYSAKGRNRQKYQFYSTSMGKKSELRLIQESSLRTALQKKEFVLHYQPQVKCEDGSLSGVEALVRWQPEGGKLRYPNDFITLAEETGLIIELGSQVLDMACAQAKKWSDLGNPIRVSVNLSAKQFQTEELITTVKKTIERYHLDPSLIELEVTESMTMENSSRSSWMITSLRELGVSISIDDFGTGYSSLSYLKDFSINQIKIDKSFIDELTHNVKSDQITSAIIAMSKQLKLHVIAEGVETIEQAQFLSDKGCDSIQGYFFSKPVTSEQIESTYLAVGQSLA